MIDPKSEKLIFCAAEKVPESSRIVKTPPVKFAVADAPETGEVNATKFEDKI